MSGERDVNKIDRTVPVGRILERKILFKFGKAEDDGQKTKSYLRALEECTKDVMLTVDDYRKIEAETAEALKKRMAKRKAR